MKGASRPFSPRSLLENRTQAAWLLLGIALPLLVVGAIAAQLSHGARFSFEAPLMLAVHALATPGLTAFMVDLSALGNVGFSGYLVALGGLVIWRARPKAAVFLLASALGAALINVLVKPALHRGRPELWPRLVPESGTSFPSGHAMYSAALATAVILLTWRTRYRLTALILAVPFAFLVGLSRIYLGVHYPTDVLAGWLSGVAWTAGLWTLGQRNCV